MDRTTTTALLDVAIRSVFEAAAEVDPLDATGVVDSLYYWMALLCVNNDWPAPSTVFKKWEEVDERYSKPGDQAESSGGLPREQTGPGLELRESDGGDGNYLQDQERQD